MRVVSLLSAVAAATAAATPDLETAQLAEENSMLQLKLKRLEDELQQELKYSYVVVKGYITDAENIFMETMEVDEAKQYCNANADCKGFTFGGPNECAASRPCSPRRHPHSRPANRPTLRSLAHVRSVSPAPPARTVCGALARAPLPWLTSLARTAGGLRTR